MTDAGTRGLCHLLLGDRAGGVGAPRRLAGGPLRVVAPRAGLGDLDEPFARRGIADHHDLGALAVAAARGEAGVVEDRVEDVVGQRVVGEVAHGRGRAHHVVQVHAPHASHSARNRVEIAMAQLVR